MRRPPSAVRNAIVALARHGHVADVDLDGRHYKISWTAHNRKHVLVISRTPSDRRADMNSRAPLQRLLRDGEELQ